MHTTVADDPNEPNLPLLTTQCPKLRTASCCWGYVWHDMWLPQATPGSCFQPESWGLILWWSEPGLWGNIGGHQVVSTWGSMMRSCPMFISQRVEVWGCSLWSSPSHWPGGEQKTSEFVSACVGLLSWTGDHLPTLLASSTSVHQYPDTSILHLPASLANKLTLPSIGDVFLVCWRQSPSYGSKCSAGQGLTALSLCKKKRCWWILVFRPNPAPGLLLSFPSSAP